MKQEVFTDFDAFAASVQGIESKMLLRNPQRHFWSHSAVRLGRGIDVQLGRLGSGNIAQGQLRPDGFMIYLPLTPNIEYSANAQVLQPGAMAILEPGCEFCVSTRVEHDWCAAFLPLNLLPAQFGSGNRRCQATAPRPDLARRFRSSVSQLMAAAAASSSFEESLAAAGASASVLELGKSILGIESTNYLPVERNAGGRPRVSRDAIIQRCMKVIEQQPAAAVDLQDLIIGAGVSERTLRNAFNEYFGMGPGKYLQLRQMHSIHRALRKSDPRQVTVAEVLTQHGEWSLGRFANRYRKLFGELPSATLRSGN